MADPIQDCRPGTLIFQDLPNEGSLLVDIIEKASGNPSLSHVAMITRKRSDGTCLAIEALKPVAERPLDQIIQKREAVGTRSYIKIVPAELADALTRQARKFKGQPYDYEYRNDNKDAQGYTPIYCSELIAEAGKAAGGKLAVLDAVSIPATWLDLSYPSVQKYIKEMGYSGVDDPRLKSHRVTTVVDLYFNDLLETPKGYEEAKSLLLEPRIARYDTLRGKTVDEKFKDIKQYLARGYKLKLEKDPERDNYRISYDTMLGRHSLILFGVFPEEKDLAQRIIREFRLKQE